MKKYIYLIVVALVMICATVGLSLLWQNQQPSSTSAGSDYNPNYADAIQQKKPELCQSINYALLSGPTDSIDKVYGDEAVRVCESQAKEGFFGCECDSEAVLNSMRNR